MARKRTRRGQHTNTPGCWKGHDPEEDKMFVLARETRQRDEDRIRRFEESSAAQAQVDQIC